MLFKKILFSIALIALSFAYSPTANSEDSLKQQFQEALSYYESNKHKFEDKKCCHIPEAQTALRKFLELAEKGHAESQSRVGWMYLLNKGVPYDMEKGVYWLRKAAEQEHISAMINMAAITSEAIIVPPNEEQVKIWYEKVAKHGEPIGQYNLSAILYNEKNYISAFAWNEAAIVNFSSKTTNNWDEEIAHAKEFKAELIEKHLTKEELEKAKTLAQQYLQEYPHEK